MNRTFESDDMDYQKTEFDNHDSPEIVEIPIEDILDLHLFHPRDIKPLLEEYLVQAQKLGFPTVRIIHGKGCGVLRAKTQSILKKHPAVQNYQTADEGRGGWGATIVWLKKRD